MNRETYDVVLAGMPEDPGAVDRLMETFGIDVESAKGVLSQLPTVVKSGVPLDVARNYERAFAAMGGRCELRQTKRRAIPDTAPIAWSTPRMARGTPGPATRPPPRPTPTPTFGTTAAPPPQRRWLVPVVIAGLALLAGGLYWHLRAPRMGGLVVERIGDEGLPAIVLLHGFGADGDDLVPFARELAGQLPNIQVVVPEGRLKFRGGRVWWKADIKEAHGSTNAVIKLIDELIDEGTAPDDILVAGYSQGAILAMDVGLNHEQVLGGVAMLSGTEEPQLGWDNLMTDRSALPIFISHGRSDSVLSFRTAQSLVSKLKAHDFAVDFVPYPGGHAIGAQARAKLVEFAEKTL